MDPNENETVFILRRKSAKFRHLYSVVPNNI